MKLAPYTESKQRLEKEADHFRLVGGRFNKPGDLHKRHGCPQGEQTSALPTGMLNSIEMFSLGPVPYSVQMVSTKLPLKSMSFKQLLLQE